MSTVREVTLWRVQHDLEYNILRGGHEKAVISLYACAGGTGATPGEQDYRWVGDSQGEGVETGGEGST